MAYWHPRVRYCERVMEQIGIMIIDILNFSYL